MDVDGFTTVAPKRKKTRTSSISSTNSTTSANDLPMTQNSNSSIASTVTSSAHQTLPYQPKPTLYTATITNLPARYLTYKNLHFALSQIKNLSIYNTTIMRTGIVLIKSPDPLIAQLLRPLRDITASNLIVTQTDQQPSRAPAAPRQQSYSCVIKGVDLDVTVDDVSAHLKSLSLDYKLLWRIKSKVTNQDTRLIRVVTSSQATVDTLLSQGINIFSHHHYVEPSHPPKPQPQHCFRCSEFHDNLSECRNKPKCGRCAGPHLISNCNFQSATVKCANCNGDHPASSVKCPKRPKEPVSATTIAPIKCLDPPAIEDTDTTPTTYNLLRFITTAFLNAMPDQRPRIQQILCNLSAHFFNTKLTISYTGNSVHVGCCPTTSYASAVLNRGT